MKLPLPKIKIGFARVINIILALVILSEIYFVYSLLYQNLNPEPAEVVPGRIVKVDLKAYRETSDLLKAIEEYSPSPLNFQNQNPFKYSD